MVSPIFASDDLLDARDHEADLARARARSTGIGFGVKTPELLDLVVPPDAISRTFIPGVERAVDHADEDDDAAVLVEPGVEDQRPQRRVGIALGGGRRVDDGLEDLVDADALLGGGQDGARRRRCR